MHEKSSASFEGSLAAIKLKSAQYINGTSARTSVLISHIVPPDP
jgi:hypothetical protein